jgi:hypothetical protein
LHPLLLLLLLALAAAAAAAVPSLCSGVLGFGDVIDVGRLLLEASDASSAAVPAPCSVQGYGTYGEPVFTMVEQQPLAGTTPGYAVSNSNLDQPSSTGSSSTSGMRLSAPAGDPETPGAYALSIEADNSSSSSSRAAQERIMLQESGLQEAAVRQLTSCTPLLTSGRLLGIGGLANCTVGALSLFCCLLLGFAFTSKAHVALGIALGSVSFVFDGNVCIMACMCSGQRLRCLHRSCALPKAIDNASA